MYASIFHPLFCTNASTCLSQWMGCLSDAMIQVFRALITVYCTRQYRPWHWYFQCSCIKSNDYFRLRLTQCIAFPPFPCLQLVPGLGPQKPAIGFLLLALVKEAILFCWPGWTALCCAARYLPRPVQLDHPRPWPCSSPSNASGRSRSRLPSPAFIHLYPNFFSLPLLPTFSLLIQSHPKIRLRRLHYSRPAQSPIALNSDQSD